MKKIIVSIVAVLVVAGVVYAGLHWQKGTSYSSSQEGGYNSLEGVEDSENTVSQPSVNTPTSNTTNPAPVQQDSCSLLANNHYQSTEELEGGMGPNGAVKAYWKVDFSGAKVTYQHSDVVENGTYTCSLGKLKAVFSGNTVNASYDRKSGVLTWEGHEYIKATSKPIFCGGFAGLSCPSGYSCIMEGNYPDAGGTCVKN